MTSSEFDQSQSLLHEAAQRARRDAARHLEHLLGFDLRSWIDDDRDRRPAKSRTDPDGLASLDVVGAIARCLAHHDLGDVGADGSSARLVRTSDGIDRDVVPEIGEIRRRAGDGPIRADALGLAAGLHAGASFKVRWLELASPQLRDLVEDLGLVAGVRCGLMAYLSGPGAVGWGPHYDRHDGVIVQIQGSKRWTVFHPVETRPCPPWTRYQVSDDVAWTGTLDPGDVLLVPRGWGHEVTGTGSASVHLTIPLSLPAAGEVVADAIRGGALAMSNADPDAEPFAAWDRRRSNSSRSDTSLCALAAVHGRLEDPAINDRVRVSLASVPARSVDARPAGPSACLGDVHASPDHEMTSLLTTLAVRGGVSWQEALARNPGSESKLRELVADRIARVWIPAPPPGRPGTIHLAPMRRPEHIGLQPLGRSTVVRLPDPERPDERHLYVAARTLRDRAIAGLRSLIPDLDLVTPMDRPRSAVATSGRLSSAGAHILLEGDTIDELFASRDLGAGRMAVSSGGRSFNAAPPDDMLQLTSDPASPALVDVTRLFQYLCSGLSVICFGIDRSFDVLSDTSELVEAVSGARSGVNAYVSADRGAEGFGLHWDDHDVLVIQIRGQKHWRIHQPADPFPVRGWTSDAGHGEVVLDQTLEPGDVLYVPRGWGHQVKGTDGLSVHYTFPMRTPLVGAALRQSAAGTQGLVSAAIAAHRAAIPTRAGARIDRLPRADQADGSPVRLSAPGGPVIVDGAPKGRLRVAMAEWILEVPVAVLPALGHLLSGAPTTRDDLIASVDGPSTEVGDLIAALLSAGLAAPVPATESVR